jgi:hypothetical protein
MDFSVYDDSEIQRHARRLALAAGEEALPPKLTEGP